MAQAQTRYLRPDEVKQLEEEVTNLNNMLADPNAVINDRAGAFRRRNSVGQQLERETPPDTTDSQKDVLVKREKELRDAILVGMPSKAVMRQMPDGAVGQHMKHKDRNKARIQMWKNIVLTINKGTTDNGIANIERFRPLNTVSDLGLSSRRVGSSSLHSFPSDQFSENYDMIDWRADEALALSGDVEPAEDAPVDRGAEFVDEAIRANDLADLRLAISEAAKEEREASGAEVPEQLTTDALG